MDLTKLKRESLCVQAGWQPKNGEARVLPVFQSTTFKYDDTEQMADLFDLKASGYFYTRLQNPTNDAVAAKIAALEGGVAAMLTSSGQAANFYAIFNICQAGDHMITTTSIYGGTYNLFGVTFPKMGIEITFIDQDASDEEWAAAFRPNTKLVFGETLSNPNVRILDIERIANIAHDHGVPLIVDNTFPTPVNCRPFEFGADIVTHSTTKYMDGHASQVGGCVVDSGNFDWEAQHDKFTCLTEPDESYHGLTYTTAFGNMAYTTKMVVQLMRDLGSIPAPQNSFLLNIGLETLALRMRQHCSNAQKVAEWLEKNEKVGWVSYASLPSNQDYALAQKYLPNGTCGVIAFGLKGSREEAIRFMDNLDFISIVTHVADARTCVLHPASETHRQLSDEQLVATLQTVHQHLVTPRGIRTLSPRNLLYKSNYNEDQRSQDLASRNGSAWVWPLMFYVKACFAIGGERFVDDARKLLEAFDAELQTKCVGSISERFEGDPPYNPRGGVSHATSVAGLLLINSLIEKHSAKKPARKSSKKSVAEATVEEKPKRKCVRKSVKK